MPYDDLVIPWPEVSSILRATNIKLDNYFYTAVWLGLNKAPHRIRVLYGPPEAGKLEYIGCCRLRTRKRGVIIDFYPDYCEQDLERRPGSYYVPIASAVGQAILDRLHLMGVDMTYPSPFRWIYCIPVEPCAEETFDNARLKTC